MAELNASEKPRRRGAMKKLSPRIDLTAMVDLAFLLITFFIMTTTLAKSRAMDIVMPVRETPPAAEPESRTMTICLGKNNQALWYLGRAEKPVIAPTLVNFGKTGLRAAIINTGKNIFQRSGKPMIVILKPGSHTLYADFVAAVDELNITNVQSYAIADITSKDIDLLKQQNAW